MSIVQLADGPRGRRSGPHGDQARERLVALVTELETTHLGAAEEFLAGMVAHQHAGTRGLSVAEASTLARLGVPETELTEPTALTATAKGLVWEEQAAAQSATVTEAAELLGVTPARVRQRCAAGTLLAQRRTDGWHLPLFQFPDGRELRGWASVARVIPRGVPLLLAERVLTSPAMRLRIGHEALAPLEWLAQGGDPEAAAQAVDDALNRLP